QRRCSVSHRVTLTFDNGPTTRVTPWVLDVLRERGIRSTFFVVGEQLRSPGSAAIARRAAADGHWIGHHTPTPSVPLGELADPVAIDREIAETQGLIGDLSHPDRLFRPFGRGGIIDERLLGLHAVRRLEEGRFTCVLWNSVPRDWERPDGWVTTCLDDVVTRPWSVVVVHDLPIADRRDGSPARAPRRARRLVGGGGPGVSGRLRPAPTRRSDGCFCPARVELEAHPHRPGIVHPQDGLLLEVVLVERPERLDLHVALLAGIEWIEQHEDEAGLLHD